MSDARDVTLRAKLAGILSTINMPQNPMERADAILSALNSAGLSPPEWKPIETAPKDGTRESRLSAEVARVTDERDHWLGWAQKYLSWGQEIEPKLRAAERARDEAVKALAEARANALEEAAKICELVAAGDIGGSESHLFGCAEDECAYRIRALSTIQAPKP